MQKMQHQNMKVYTTIHRGYQHKHFCEDFMLATANENWFFGVVSDGCSSFVVALGDGAVAIDDHIYEIDQANTPNYPAFYLGESKESLDNYFLKHYFEVENAKQIAIATDGVFSFNNEKNFVDVDKNSIANYLLVDNSLQNVSNMLNRKLNILQIKQNISPADDIAIVRLIF